MNFAVFEEDDDEFGGNVNVITESEVQPLKRNVKEQANPKAGISEIKSQVHEESKENP